MPTYFNRRSLFAGVGSATATSLLPQAGNAAYVSSQDGFGYEVQRTEEAWKELLGKYGYFIMRQGGTEIPTSSPLWKEERAGEYTCKGCDLQIYKSAWKVQLDKGWAFFRHAEPNSILTGIDWPQGEPDQPDMMTAFGLNTAVEVHCRRCGNHLGHIVSIKNKVLHCINGISLNFLKK